MEAHSAKAEAAYAPGICKPGSAGYSALKLKPGCDALATRFGSTSWRVDNGELVLLSAREESWRFEENDADSWQRVPETADPILLVQQ